MFRYLNLTYDTWFLKTRYFRISDLFGSSFLFNYIFKNKITRIFFFEVKLFVLLWLNMDLKICFIVNKNIYRHVMFLYVCFGKPNKYFQNNLLMNLFYVCCIFILKNWRKVICWYIDNKVKLIANTQAYKHNFKSHKKPTNLIFCFQVKTHLITINKLCFIKQTKVKQQRQREIEKEM